MDFLSYQMMAFITECKQAEFCSVVLLVRNLSRLSRASRSASSQGKSFIIGVKDLH